MFHNRRRLGSGGRAAPPTDQTFKTTFFCENGKCLIKAKRNYPEDELIFDIIFRKVGEGHMHVLFSVVSFGFLMEINSNFNKNVNFGASTSHSQDRLLVVV